MSGGNFGYHRFFAASEMAKVRENRGFGDERRGEKRMSESGAEWVELLQEGGLMACHAYTWKQVVGTPLFAENELALRVGDGDDDAITVVRMPARYSSFDAAATDPPPAPGQHNDALLSAPEPAS